MGVITTELIPEGKLLGPIPSTLTLTDPAYLIGHMTSDSRPDVHKVKVNVADLSNHSKTAEWLPYVQGARSDKEQNLEAFLKNGELHYRAIKDVQPNAELLVWYSNDYARLLGIPELQSFYIKDNGIISCPYCMDNFKFPNSLRAHMRFKCTYRKSVPTTTQGIEMKKHSIMEPLHVKDKHYISPFVSGIYKGPVPGFHTSPTIRIPTSTHLIPSPNSSIGSNGSSSEGKPSPSICDTDKDSYTFGHVNRLHKRRYSDDDVSVSIKKLRSDENGTKLSVNSQRKSLSPPLVGSDNLKVDQNQNVPAINVTDDDENVSAFRKVEKSSPRSNVSPPTSLPSPPVERSLHSSHDTAPMTSLYSPTFASTPKSMVLTHVQSAAVAAASAFAQRPMLPGGAALRPSFPGGAYNENLPMNLSDLYRGHEKQIMRDSVSLPQKLQMEAGKLPLLVNGQLGSVAPYPYYKVHNPMVDKMLTIPPGLPPTMNTLSQNWCAKCNATFRMTSDLVYHMRSHHKRDFDPLKRKREEKLKCNTCGETFRERHHLTRHMTSHM